MKRLPVGQPIEESAPSALTDGPSPNIGFRIDAERHKQLKDRAIQAGVSIHEMARGLVNSALDGTTAEKRMIDKIDRLTREHTAAVEVLLTAILARERVDLETAKKWVRENLGGSA